MYLLSRPFWTHRACLCNLSDVRLYESSLFFLSICLSSYHVHLRMFLSILQEEQLWCLFLSWDFMRFLQQSLISGGFLVLLRYSFLIFLSSLFDGVRFQYCQVLVIFLLSKQSDASLIKQFYSFPCLFSPTFHFQYGTIFNAKSHSYVLAVYSYCLYQGL